MRDDAAGHPPSTEWGREDSLLPVPALRLYPTHRCPGPCRGSGGVSSWFDGCRRGYELSGPLVDKGFREGGCRPDCSVAPKVDVRISSDAPKYAPLLLIFGILPGVYILPRAHHNRTALPANRDLDLAYPVKAPKDLIKRTFSRSLAAGDVLPRRER